MTDPNILKPALKLGTTAKVYIAIIMICAVGIGGAFYVKKLKGKNPADETELYVQQGFDPDFFSRRKKQETEPEEPTPPIVQVNTRNPALEELQRRLDLMERQNKSLRRELSKPRPTVIHPVQPQTVAIDTQQNEVVDIAPVQADPNEAQRTRINASRRGTSSFKTFNRSSDSSPGEEYVLTQPKWAEPELKASLPVDLTRVVTKDRFITAILINEINSQLQGQVVCQIENNVYGTHGRKVLIPAGSKGIGHFEAVGDVGIERLAVIWERIITPEGINIHLGDAGMVDQMGRSGITGEVDRRYFARYGVALLISSFSALSTLSVDVSDYNTAQVVEGYTRGVSEVSKQVLQENLKIKPIIKIPGGSRIHLIPSQDIRFPEPEKMDDKDIKVSVVEK